MNTSHTFKKNLADKFKLNDSVGGTVRNSKEQAKTITVGHDHVTAFRRRYGKYHPYLHAAGIFHFVYTRRSTNVSSCS
jgi:hypothetical protein